MFRENLWMSQVQARARWLLHPGSRLSRRVLHAGMWAFALRITLRIFTTVRTIILARLLVPGDFGLMGIALLMISLLETFTKTGFSSALVQRQGDIRPYLDTAWTIQVLRGILLAAVLVMAAPFIGSFFETPQAVLIIQVMALAIVIEGFKNIGVIFFHKDLEFQKRFLDQTARTLTEVGITIGLTLVFRNVWALVFGMLAGVTAQVVASYFLHPYRPRLRLEWAKAKELYKFGRWVFLANIVVFLSLKADSLAVGKLLGAPALGFYQLANRFGDMFRFEMAAVVNNVAFPAYAKLQDDLTKLRRAYFASVEVVTCVTLPAAVALTILGADFTRVILGEQWLPMVPALRILAIAAFVRSVAANGGMLFYGAGLPRFDFYMNLVNTLVVVALLYPFIQAYGLMGTSIAILAGICAALPLYFWQSAKILHVGVAPYIKSLGSATTLSAAVGGALLVAKILVPGEGVLAFVTAVVLGGGVYGAAVLGMWRFVGKGPLATMVQAGRSRAAVSLTPA